MMISKIDARAYKREQIAAFNRRFGGVATASLATDALAALPGQMRLADSLQRVVSVETLQASRPYRDGPVGADAAALGAFHALCVQVAQTLGGYRQAQAALPQDAAVRQLAAESRPYLAAVKTKQLPTIAKMVGRYQAGLTVRVEADATFGLWCAARCVAVEPAAANDWRPQPDDSVRPKPVAGAPGLASPAYWAFCRATIAFRQLWLQALWREAQMQY